MLAQKEERYADVLLLDTEFRILLSAEPQPHPVSPATKNVIEQALADRTATLSDLYRCPTGMVHVDAVGSILDAEGRPVAVLVLRSNAESLLYHLIQSWPTPSRTAETLLVQRDGEDVLFLNDLRHRPDSALSLREPLTRDDLPAAQVVLGKEGIFLGKDYRGVEVMGELRHISGSPWFMVAKVDASEILAEARYRGGIVALFSALFIVLAASVTAYGYRYRQVRLYRDLYRSEREQREALSEFRTTLYSIGDAVITVDTGGLVKQMNPVAERLTGWQEAEARGKPMGQVFRIVNEETRAKVEDPVARVLREGLVVGLANQTLLIAKDGSECPISDSGAPICDESGAITGVVLAFQDQSQDREAQMVLQESEERFRILSDGAFEGVVISRDGFILDFNEVFCKITGYTLEELVGRNIQDIVAPEFKRIAMEHVLSGIEEAYESAFVRKDGHLVPVQVKGKTIPYAGGTARIASIRDISATRRAEEVQRRLATAIEQAAEAILITDSEGIIHYINPAVERIAGLRREELLGKTPRVFKSGEHDQAFYRHLWDTIKAGNVWSGWFTNRSKDGCLYHENATISPVRDTSGQIVNFVAVKRDITEHLDLYRQLLQAQKMEAVGTLAGGVAHDFNNILQVALGYSELILGDEGLPQRYKADLQKISESARRGVNLVQGLLTFSRKTEVKRLPLNLNRRINEVRKMLDRTVPKMIEIQLFVAEDVAGPGGGPRRA